MLFWTISSPLLYSRMKNSRSYTDIGILSTSSHPYFCLLADDWAACDPLPGNYWAAWKTHRSHGRRCRRDNSYGHTDWCIRASLGCRSSLSPTPNAPHPFWWRHCQGGQHGFFLFFSFFLFPFFHFYKAINQVNMLLFDLYLVLYATGKVTGSHSPFPTQPLTRLYV
jgi:hypothetical protein